MALSQQDYNCLAVARPDIIRFYVANNWVSSNVKGIFDNWWANGHGATVGDEAGGYASLDDYAAYKHCAGGGSGTTVQPAVGTAGGGGSAAGAGTISTTPHPTGTGATGAFTGGLDGFLQFVQQQAKNDPIVVVGGVLAAIFIFSKLRQN